MEKIINTWSDEDKIICPYCGYERKVDFETFHGDSADCEEEMECENCGKTFIAFREVKCYYGTHKKNNKIHNKK